MSKTDRIILLITSIVTIAGTLIAVIISGNITTNMQKEMLAKELNYTLAFDEIKQKTKLYGETIDILQIIHTDLQPNLMEKVLLKETVPITNKFSNVMNRSILYFNDDISKMIEEVIKNEYWNITKEEIQEIMGAMANEIKEDKKNLKSLYRS